MKKMILLLWSLLLLSSAVATQAAEPLYNQPSNQLQQTQPVPRTADPALVPANRNPYFDDPAVHVEGVPTGNPDIQSVPIDASKIQAPLTTVNSNPEMTNFSGHTGTDGVNGSGF
jgi:hypothetical protein